MIVTGNPHIRSAKESATAVLPVGIQIPTGYFNMHCLNYPYDGVTSQTPNPTDIVLGTVRRGLHWNLIEPTQGARNFNVSPYFMDIYVDTHLARGYKTALVVPPGRHPAWAAVGGVSSPQYRAPAQDSYWTDFVAAVMANFAGKIASIEFANEPSNIGTWLDTHADYARLFRLGRDAVIAADPTVPVVGPSCQSLVSFGNGLAWMTNFFAASDGVGGTGKDHIDIVGVHYYPSPVSDTGKILTMGQSVNNLLADSGVTLPVWNMESGRLNTTANPVFSDLPLADKLRAFKAHCMLPAVTGCEKTMYYAYDTVHMGWFQDPDRGQFVALWDQMRAFEGQTIHTIQARSDGGWNLDINGVQFII